MSRACELANILPDPTVSVSESTLSVIEWLMPKSDFNNALLLNKKHPSEVHQYKATVVEDPNLSANGAQLDITGTPLEYDLNYPQLDDTIIHNRNWKKHEESYLPLVKWEARLAINCCCNISTMQNWGVPVLAICDGKDDDKTILIGINVKEQWFTTVQVVVSDAQLLSNIEESPNTLFKEYTNIYSTHREKVTMTVFSRYELCGKRPGVLDSSDIKPGIYNGSLSIEVHWNTLSFYPPIRNSSSILIMEIIAGWNESNLKNLWNELALIHQYLNMLEECQTHAQTPHTMNPVNSLTWEEIEEKLSLLLNEAVENRYSKDAEEGHNGDITDQDKIKKLVNNIQSRPNMDFIDMLWELLKDCADYTQLTSCFHTVLHQVQTGCALPQFTSTNLTRITNIISKILNREGAVPLLEQNSPLELFIDTGLEKLCRDYTYVLLSANLIDLHDIRHTICNIQNGAFNIESYRKKLTLLARIHLCLEFTLLAENYLSCPSVNLRSIFSYAFRKYVSQNLVMETHWYPPRDEIQRLNVPLSTIAVEHIARSLPSSWCLTLSSESSESAFTTTSYLSRTPIVPPNIYCSDEDKENEVYHCLKLSVSSMNFARC